MKKLVVTVIVLVCVACAVARGESPARVVGTVATNGTSFTVAGTTQTVSLVQGSITNRVGVKVVSATSRMLVLTNAPWLFQGESVRITTTATSAFPVVCTGVTGD